MISWEISQNFHNRFYSELLWTVCSDDFSKIYGIWGKYEETGTCRCFDQYQFRKFYSSQEFIHSYFKTFRKSHSKTPSKGFCFGKLGDQPQAQIPRQVFRVNFGKFLRTSFYKSSHWRCSVKKHVLNNFTNFTGKHMPWSLFLIKLQAHVIKKRLQRRCFAVKFAKFLRAPILKNFCERLLLFLKAHSQVRDNFWHLKAL